MKMKKTKNILMSLVVASSIASCVQASEIGLSTSISATNNYVVRGLSQSNDKGAVFGEATVLYGDFFAGVWASNVEFEGADADSEIDLYVGYATSFDNINVSLDYTRFLYPNSDDVAYYDEATVDLSYTLDKLTVGGKYSFGTYTENDAKELDYYEGYASYDFDVLTLTATGGEYEDIGTNYSVGVSKTYALDNASLTLDLTYAEFNAEAQSGYEDENNLYATITYAF